MACQPRHFFQACTSAPASMLTTSARPMASTDVLDAGGAAAGSTALSMVGLQIISKRTLPRPTSAAHRSFNPWCRRRLLSNDARFRHLVSNRLPGLFESHASVRQRSVFGAFVPHSAGVLQGTRSKNESVHAPCVPRSPRLRRLPRHRRPCRRLPLKPCHVDGVKPELKCGLMQVPENRSVKGGRMLSLEIIVIPAQKGPAKE